MGLLDVLSQYADRRDQPPPQVLDDFDTVAQQAPPELLGEGLQEAFRSEQTPPFEQMVGHLFDRSDPDQRAGLINQILGSLGPSALAGFGGGALQDMLRRAGNNQRSITPAEARNVPAQEVESVAAEAARKDPGIIERISRFYAEHPQLVQSLGQVALSIAMGQMARRRRM